jgi:hypothetical protein
MAATARVVGSHNPNANRQRKVALSITNGRFPGMLAGNSRS